MTSYRVMRQTTLDDEEHGPHSAYEVIGSFEAHDAKGAISLAAEQLGEDAHGATFAAVPDRRWSEHSVAVETKTAVRVG